MVDSKQVGEHYDKVDYQKGPEVYNNEVLYRIMSEMGEFRARNVPYLVADMMCGEGLVGQNISEILIAGGIDHEMHFIDVTEKN